MIRRPPRSTHCISSAASDVYKRQPEIGRKFANRDHTTVIHAVKTVEKLLQNNDEIKKNIEELKSLILSDTNAISN